MLARLTLAAILAFPALGAGEAAAEDDVPIAPPGIAIIDQIDVTDLPPLVQASAQIEQQGTGNRSEIHQRDGGSNDALSVQSGTGIQTRIVQGGGRGIVRVFAEGTGHSGVVEQNGGFGNFAELRQQGPGPNTADLRQWGEANQLIAGQTSILPGLDGGTYLGVQNGMGNRASAVQDGVGLFASQHQFGRSNSARLFQQGADSDAVLFQGGVQNSAEQIQIGSGLSSVIIQANDNNTAVSQQIGDNLDPVVIIQHGGAAVSVTVQAGAH